jgi:hypothetical protein
MSDRLNVGGVIRRVFDIYVDQASVLLPASAVVFVVTGILSAVLVAAASGLAVVALLLSLVATTLFTGMVVELVADLQDGRRDHSPGELLRSATPVLGQLILVGIVAGVGIVIGFLLIVVPGLILITIWSVAAPVVVLERPGVFAALGRSRELVRGNGWQVFGVIFVLFFLVLFVSSGVEIAAVLTGPFSALAAAVLYFELRGAGQATAAGAGLGTGGAGDDAAAGAFGEPDRPTVDPPQPAAEDTTPPAPDEPSPSPGSQSPPA